MGVESVTGLAGASLAGLYGKGGGRADRVEEKWKSLYGVQNGVDVGKARFDAADVDGDDALTPREAREALLPVEERFLPLMQARYNRHAGDDGLLQRSEARQGRDFERTHADAIRERLWDRVKEGGSEANNLMADLLIEDKARRARQLHERYPNASREEIRQAVDNPVRGRAAEIVHHLRPELSKERVDKAVRKLESEGDRVEDRFDRVEDRRDRREDVRDLREDQRDRREDVWDAQHDGGRRDRLEDKLDRREDRWDAREDRRDAREDQRDKGEDRWNARHDGVWDPLTAIHDRREDRWDAREDRRDRREDARDRREDVRDAQHDGGRRDRIEDRLDRIEDRFDRREDIRDRREDRRDRLVDFPLHLFHR